VTEKRGKLMLAVKCCVTSGNTPKRGIMSRVGVKPIRIPEGVKVSIEGSCVKVEGPKGALERHLQASIEVRVEDDVITVHRASDSAMDRSLHGLSRTLLANMIEGVTKGYQKMLELHGIAYRATMQGLNLNLQLRYSHPVVVEPPDGISIECERRGAVTDITVTGIDKELVGQTAARVRSIMKPEPYKGTGIRYKGEYIRRKAGKTGV